MQDRIRIAFNLTDYPLRLLLISNRIGGGGGGDELNRVNPRYVKPLISLVFAAGTLRRASLGLISKNPSKNNNVSADVHQCLDVNRPTKSTTPSVRMQITMNS